MKIIRREKCYPFGKRRYQIPSGRNIKKALHQDELYAVYNYQSDCPSERKAKDLWLFCYFGNGMNPKDLVYLKYKNMQDGYLVFLRAKTERTTRLDPKLITIYITEDMYRIIETWGKKGREPDNYIFPIMQPNLNPLDQYELVTAFTQFINDNMMKIASRLEIEKKLTTIVSRHTFSTQLKRCGASTEYIQEALGHTDKKTTENYMDSFEREVKKEFAMKLLEFRITVG
jgi:integrase